MEPEQERMVEGGEGEEGWEVGGEGKRMVRAGEARDDSNTDVVRLQASADPKKSWAFPPSVHLAPILVRLGCHPTARLGRHVSVIEAVDVYM